MGISTECKLKVDIYVISLNCDAGNLADQKPLNLLPIPPTGLVPTAQPVGQLLGVPAHLASELLQGQSIDLLVPGQSSHQIFGAGDRVVAEELDNFWHAIQCD